MRVLFVCPRWPYPVRKGDQVVAYQRLRTLSRDHDITLVSFSDRPLAPSEIEKVAAFCRSVYIVKTSKWERAAAAVSSAFRRDVPLQVSYYDSEQFTGLVDHLLSSGEFDIVHSLLLRLAPSLQKFAGRVVLELVDSMELNFRRQLQVALKPWRRLVIKEEHSRLMRYEAAMAKNFPQRTAVSELDRELLGDETLVVPNGVVVPAEVPPEMSRRPTRLVFHGNLGYHANCAAVAWLMEEVWPRVTAARPDAELFIVGSNPPPWIQRMNALPGVTVTGDVPSVADVLKHCAIALAPMRSGSGIQNKVLEAMAAGLPVVATSYATGGLGDGSEQAMLVANEPAAFAERILALLQDGGFRQQLGLAGYRYVARFHSWEAAAARIEGLYWRAARSPSPWAATTLS